MQDYRVRLLTKTGAVLSARRIRCADDRVAIERAQDRATDTLPGIVVELHRQKRLLWSSGTA